MTLTREELVSFMETKLGVDTSDMEDTTPIFSTGMVDSFSLVSLITFIEKRGGFRVSPLDVNLENLDTIARIMSYAERKVTNA